MCSKMADNMNRVKQILNDLDELFSERTDAARVMWNILTALRGPDNEDQDDKYYTVAVRRAAFPKTANKADLGHIFDIVSGPLFAYPGGNYRLPNITALRSWDLESDHFHSHIEGAAYALRELNNDESKANTPVDSGPTA